jgi:hypothetical protein
VYFYYIQVTLVICIGATQINAMGELAVQMYESVIKNNLHGDKQENCWDKVIKCVPISVQKWFVFIFSTALMATSIAFLVTGVIFWSTLEDL